MTRALYVTALSVVFALFGAAAEAKPTIAVLGLEVTSPDTGSVDQQTTAGATNLTNALRDRVHSGTGPYETAGGSDKELIDLKLLNDCSSEAGPCMAKIGNDLGAKYLLYGRLSKTGSNYHVSVTLFNVDTKTKVTTKAYDVPTADLAAAGKGALVWGRKIYGELTGETSQGTVTVKVTGADHGTLLVLENGTWQPKGSISSGQGRTTLPEGRYKIAVESEGFQRFEQSVTITAGTDTPLPVTLAPMPKVDTGNGNGTPLGQGSDAMLGTGSDHSYSGTVSEGDGQGWHKAFVGTAIGAGVLAVGFGVSFAELSSTGKADSGTFQYGSKCHTPGQAGDPGACANGSTWNALTYVTGIGAVAFGGFALVALYESHRSSSSGEHAAVGRRSHRQFAVTPVVSPTTAGASFRLDW